MGDNAAESSPPRRKGRWLRRLFYLGALLAALPLLNALAFGALARPDARADVILVPGAALVDGGKRLSDMLHYRMAEAVRLYQEGHAPLIVVSGGGEGNWSEPRAMRRFAEERGVPAAAIVEDHEGLTTRLSAQNLRKLTGDREASVIPVTQWYHLGRIRLALWQEGFSASGAPCWRSNVRNALREWPAFYAYALGIEDHRDTYHELRTRIRETLG